VAAKPKKEAPEVPAFQSDRLRLLAPLITPRVYALALQRIGERRKFFTGTTLNIDEDKSVVRMALIVAHEMHPYEDYQAEEEALIRGLDSDTLRKRKSAAGFRPL